MTGPRRVLVVDDELEVLEMTRMVLADAGFDVQTADSGVEGLRRARRDGTDLLLLDINMPGMDGWETLRLLRHDDDLARLPVVMFSVKGEVRDKVHAMQEGANDYITKPFLIDDLVMRVRRLIGPAGSPAGGAIVPAPVKAG